MLAAHVYQLLCKHDHSRFFGTLSWVYQFFAQDQTALPCTFFLNSLSIDLPQAIFLPSILLHERVSDIYAMGIDICISVFMSDWLCGMLDTLSNWTRSLLLDPAFVFHGFRNLLDIWFRLVLIPRRVDFLLVTWLALSAPLSHFRATQPLSSNIA